MIVISGTIVELNTYEQAAAVAVGFPFGRFAVKKVWRDKTHLRVTFPSAAVCAMWKARIFSALQPN